MFDIYFNISLGEQKGYKYVFIMWDHGVRRLGKCGEAMFMLEPTIFRTRGEHANHYTTDAVEFCCLQNQHLVNNK